MRNILRVVIPVLILLGFTNLQAQPGCPAVTTASNVTVPCGQTCVNLTATAFGGAQTTSYAVNQIAYAPPFAFNTGTPVLVHTDDLWSSAISLPFNFCFYGNSFNSAIIGSNGEISFNTANAGAFNNWSIPGAVPFATDPDQFNTIMAPWQDMDPTNAGDIYYNVGGTAPCRYLEVAWYHCPMYGDPNSVSTGICTTPYQQTQMAVIYETSMAIEIYIQKKGAPCTGWNGGLAIEGIQNGNGTAATTVPGRNATQWGPVTNDAWRFTPNGAPNYTITWFKGTTQIGTGSPIQVCPTAPTTYTASATYTNCDNSTITVTSNVFVGLAGLVVSDSMRPITCNGANNGAVFANFNSNSGVISYGWSPGGAGQTTLNNIGPGTYIFTVHDSAGCIKSDTEVITNPAPVVVTVPNDTATSCSGTTNNGILRATTTGGTPSYTYLWTGNLTTNPITGLNVGNYSVTATDAHGCTGTATANVSVVTNPLTFATPQITNVSCRGGTNGQIIAPVNGGSSPITYTWSQGTGHTDTLSNLGAGTYSVTAVDANGCSATASFTVTQPLTGVNVTVANDTVTSCTGLTNIGTLTANATGGTPAYTYKWSTTATTNPVTGLAAGTYQVTVNDVFGCSGTASGTVVTRSSSLNVSVEVSNPVCAGLKGKVVAVDSGGVLPINYNWSTTRNVTDSLTTDTIQAIAGGNYSITVTDANGCSASASFTVTQPQPFFVTVPNDTIVSCAGSTTNGTLTASSTGGTPGYTYKWSNFATTNPITGLGAGTYQVTSTDRVGCTATGSGSVILVGNPITFNTPQIINATCAGTNNGEIILSTTGGTPPITFTWSGGTTQNDTIRDLAGGTYNITGTDVNGCSATASYTITQPTAIVFGTPTIVNIGCNGGNNGSITVTATGGTGVITYGWSNGTSGATVTGPAGGYIVTATDANGCSATAAYTITQSAPVAIDSADVVSLTCSTDSGSISVTASGGTAPLTYNWSPGGLTGRTITGLLPGGYTVTVTDAHGCSATAYYIVGHSSCGGCPAVNTNNNVQIPCSETCALLTASAFSAAQTTSYTVGQIPYAPPFAFNTGTPTIVHTDDLWSPIINLPFNFCFWGVAHNQIVIGSNGEISFDIGNANAFNNWSIPGPLPNTTEPDQNDCIMAPWQDLDPTFHGTIYYNITGTAPCRKFEVSWFDCPMFGDSGSVDNSYCSMLDHQTAMAVLYETTNAIDIYIKNKQVICDDLSGGVYWNGGLAIEGITSPTGNPFLTVPGRNATQWSATNDAWRFTPAGAPNYTVIWQQNGTTIATTDTVTVCPTVPTTYTVQATYTNCDNSQVVVADSVFVTPGGSLSVSIDSTHNILCNADSDGAVYASYHTTGTVTSFGWTPGGANQTSLVGIPAGTYIFTVTTTTCSKSDTVVLVNPPKVVVSIANDTFNSCTTNNLGTLSAQVSGGTPAYTYSWTNGATTSTISGLTPGTYCVTVTDSHGCTGSMCANVSRTNGNLAFGNNVVTNATCSSGGSITVNVTGGTAPITYSWTPTEPNTNALTNLTAGSYCVTVTDAGGCSVSACFTITQPSSVVINGATVKNVTCNGANNGSIIVNASGGTPPLTYSWTPNEPHSDTLTGLGAGTYTVTVTDSAGCTATAIYTITQPSAIANDSVVIVNVSCSAGGSVTVYDTGGVAPLTYLWSNGSTTDSISNVQAGTYTLTVTDAHGCSITASYAVGTAPGALVFGTPVIVNTSCNGGSTGSITVSATGGHGTITYAWGNGSTSATISGLGVGTYCVTATDSTGCSASACYNIIQPNPIVFGNAVITPVSCNGGSNGSIFITTTGGTGVDTYIWSNSATGDSITGLSQGVYCVTATDSVGCSASICYNVSQPTPIVVDSATISAITCAGSGKVILVVSGGTAPYSYTWGGGTGSSDTATVSSAGTVTVTITDANGCSITASYTVGAAVGAVAIGTPVISPITCRGDSNASITAVATDSLGGPITYSWTTGATTATITGLAPGNYCVIATDSVGCSASACYNINQPTAITFNAPVIVEPSCNGNSNGSITASASGGTGTITYQWTGGVNGATDAPLSVGTYTVTATDSLGCTASASYTLNQPAAITFGSPVIDSIRCNGGTHGGITPTVSGGTTPYTYLWSNGATTAALTGLTANQYCLTVTDSSGCSASICYTLTQPTQLVIDSATIHEATCITGGEVVLVVTGGTGSDTYVWSQGTSTVDSVTNVTPGNVSVTVSDGNGCTASATYVVPAAPNTVVIDTGVVVNDICNGGNTGSVTVTASGGIGSLHYAWSTPPGGTTNAITGLAAGNYTITVTDSLGCTATHSYTVTQPAAIVIDSVVTTQVTCTSLGSVTVYASGGTGVLTYNWPAPNTTFHGNSLNGLSAGTYVVTVTDGNGCTVAATGTVTTAPNSIVLALDTTEPSCNGFNNGSLTVVASGGAGGFTYSWSNGSTTATISNLVAGTNYCVTVHDANGCSKDTCYTLHQPAVLVINNFVATQATCNALGSILVNAAGGTPAYTYSLTGTSSGSTNPITNLVGGSTETVVVTDQHGCTVSGSDTLAPAPAPLSVADSTITDVICYGKSTGSISVTIVGGSGGYTYLWSPGGQTTSTISNLAAGIYHLTVTGTGGCVLYDSFTVTQPGPYSASVSAPSLVCPGKCDTAFVTVNGGAPGFTYSWSVGQTTQQAIICNLTTTAITEGVTVTDSHGCTATASASIGAAAQIVDTAEVVPQPCAGGGTVTIVATGGTGALTYDYSPGGSPSGSGSLGHLGSGSYTYTVHDTLGCPVSGTFIVPPSAPADVDTVTTDSTSCFGFSDGSLTVIEDSTQNAPFTYSLNGGPFGSNNVFDSLAAGTYQVVVHNSKGCADTLSNIVIGQPLQIQVSFNHDTIYNAYANTAVVLTPNVVNAINPVYSWTPTTGLACGNCAVDSATITAPTWFYLTVSDSAHPTCRASDSIFIMLQGPLIMPDAFSPNGDGKNDFFGPISLVYVIVKEFHIYNRWGQLVHNSTDPWDGKFDGKEQPSGTYIYYIEGQVEDLPNNPGHYVTAKAQGAVTLLR